MHHIDPVLGEVGPFYLWYYGLAYSIGIAGILLWLQFSRSRLALSRSGVYELSLGLALAVLIGARLVEVAFYEWYFYSDHPLLIPAIWLGGMSTHGVLAGAILAVAWFCHRHRRSFLELTDELTIPAAFLMAVGRLGNFIDGQIIGAPTDLPWGVQFPDSSGFRHPVVLYDGLKNLLLVPLLLAVRHVQRRRGVATAHFLFWYGFLRLFVDRYREYRVELFGLGPGQGFNLLMAVAGVVLMIWCVRHPVARPEESRPPMPAAADHVSWYRPWAMAALLVVPLIIPSDWTQDVPVRYGSRHPGMQHSRLYPPLAE